jgi:hypothetical protein
MNSWEDHLQAALRALRIQYPGRRSVPVSELLSELARAHRQALELDTTPDALTAALKALLTTGTWRAVPVSERRWQTRWRGVRLPDKLIDQRPSGTRAPVAWHPFLSERITGPLPAPVREKLVRLNEYLKGRQRAGQPLFEGVIGHRERALMVMGDEKALDNLPPGGWKNVCLSLEDLHCRRQAPPVPHQHFVGIQGPILIVENSDTYHTLCQYNGQAGRWSLIIYGAGNLVTAQAEGIAALADAHGSPRLHYVGDLDLTGLSIAERLRQSLLSLGHELTLETWLYALMVSQPLRTEEGKANNTTYEMSDWVPVAIREEMADLLLSEMRIPQECLTLSLLTAADMSVTTGACVERPEGVGVSPADSRDSVVVRTLS